MKKKSKKLLPVAGYDFICTNQECKYNNTRITFYEPWPITSLEEVLNLAETSKDLPQEHINFLKKKMDDGAKYALIVYPNKNNHKQIGWRNQYYCPECYVIWEKDILFGEKKENLSRCNRCGSKLRSVKDISDNGILCPSCQKPLHKNVWITKTQ